MTHNAEIELFDFAAANCGSECALQLLADRWRSIPLAAGAVQPLPLTTSPQQRRGRFAQHNDDSEWLKVVSSANDMPLLGLANLHQSFKRATASTRLHVTIRRIESPYRAPSNDKSNAPLLDNELLRSTLHRLGYTSTSILFVSPIEESVSTPNDIDRQFASVDTKRLDLNVSIKKNVNKSKYFASSFRLYFFSLVTTNIKLQTAGAMESEKSSEKSCCSCSKWSKSASTCTPTRSMPTRRR